MTQIATGDVIAVETGSGPRFVQVTHCRAPYGEVVRAIEADDGARTPGEIAGGRTLFVAIAELRGALQKDDGTVRVLGNAPVPSSAAQYPIFRVPIRNRAGQILYWWTWDGEALSVAQPDQGAHLPVREVLSAPNLAAKLGASAG